MGEDSTENRELCTLPWRGTAAAVEITELDNELQAPAKKVAVPGAVRQVLRTTAAVRALLTTAAAAVAVAAIGNLLFQLVSVCTATAAAVATALEDRTAQQYQSEAPHAYFSN